MALRQHPGLGRLALAPQQLEFGALGPVARIGGQPLAIVRDHAAAVVIGRLAQRLHRAALQLDAVEVHGRQVVLVGLHEHLLAVGREAQHLVGLELALQQRLPLPRGQLVGMGLAPAVLGQHQHQALAVGRELGLEHAHQLMVHVAAALQHQLGPGVLVRPTQVDAQQLLLALPGGEGVVAAIARPGQRADLEPAIAALVREHRLRLLGGCAVKTWHLADVERQRALHALVVRDLAVHLLGAGEALAVIHDLDLAAGLGRRALAIGRGQRRARQQAHPAPVLADHGLVDAVLLLLVIGVDQLAVEHLHGGAGEAGA